MTPMSNGAGEVGWRSGDGVGAGLFMVGRVASIFFWKKLTKRTNLEVFTENGIAITGNLEENYSGNLEVDVEIRLGSSRIN